MGGGHGLASARCRHSDPHDRPSFAFRIYPMNYEFYFLRNSERSEPEIMRVMAPSYDSAAVIVARQHGWTAAAGNAGRVAEYIEAIDIRPIEIQNIFGT